jgi:hypothetical protein
MSGNDPRVQAPPQQDMSESVPETGLQVNQAFEVSDEGCECHKDDPVVCTLGMIAPCCLLGATRSMIDSSFAKHYNPWQGCNCTCLGFLITNIVLEPCVMLGVPVPCLYGYYAVHEPLHLSKNPLGCCEAFWGYCFCFPCATCADYNTARKMVKLKKRRAKL